MIQSTRKTNVKSNDAALAAFVSKKAEIDAVLTRLQALSDDHFDTEPDDVTWADVGSLDAYAELLKRITGLQRRRSRCVAAPISRFRPARSRRRGSGQ